MTDFGVIKNETIINERGGFTDVICSGVLLYCCIAVAFLT